jgi:8-oxo-dGTP diphosphatase
MTLPIVPRIVVGALVLHEEKVLLLQRANEGTPYDGLWEFPSGKREPLEDTTTALVREVAEETGLRVRVVRPVATFDYVVEKPTERRDTVEIVFLVSLDGLPDVRLSDEHVAFAWVGPADLAGLRASDETRRIVASALAPLAFRRRARRQ